MFLKSSPTFTLLILSVAAARAADTATPPGTLRGALLSAEAATTERIRQLKANGTTAIAVILTANSKDADQSERAAVARVRHSELELYYWIEVARCPTLADAHPNWMASLQGHQQWRRFFPDAPVPNADEVIKTYPWIPILSQETYEGQLKRVRQLLADRPVANGVFLNDLQGAPSACGCGNSLCRWASDYGPNRTTKPLKDDAAARFVKEVQHAVPNSPIIPVWTTECEEHDGAKDGMCAGVGCFKGICWKAWTAQLLPLAQASPQLAVLAPFREFQRDSQVYGAEAGWVRQAIRSFETMPAQHRREPVKASRLIAVLQGWEVTEQEIAAQQRVAIASGAGGYLVAHAKIEQSWQPKLVKWR